MNKFHLGFMLGPSCWNISDLFFIRNGTDDSLPYVVGKNIEDVIQNLQNEFFALFQCFHHNQVKANPDKCHLKHR